MISINLLENRGAICCGADPRKKFFVRVQHESCASLYVAGEGNFNDVKYAALNELDRKYVDQQLESNGFLSPANFVHFTPRPESEIIEAEIPESTPFSYVEPEPKFKMPPILPGYEDFKHENPTERNWDFFPNYNKIDCLVPDFRPELKSFPGKGIYKKVIFQDVSGPVTFYYRVNKVQATYLEVLNLGMVIPFAFGGVAKEIFRHLNLPANFLYMYEPEFDKRFFVMQHLEAGNRFYGIDIRKE